MLRSLFSCSSVKSKCIGSLTSSTFCASVAVVAGSGASIPWSSEVFFKFPVASPSIASSSSVATTVPTSFFSSKVLLAFFLESESSESDRISSSLSAVDFAICCCSCNICARVFCTLGSGLERPSALTILSAVTLSQPNRWTSPNFKTSEIWNSSSSFSCFLLSSPQALHGSAEGIR